MRTPALLRALVVASTVAASVAVALPAQPVAAVAAGCRNNAQGYTEFCDQTISAVGARGSIGLLGDSVLLGSTTGISTPSLPTMLSNNGYGPIRSTTSTGMTTYFSSSGKRDASAFHWPARWKASGFIPKTIVVNLGANMLGTCTQANPAPCKVKLDQLLNEIVTQFPGVMIWFQKTNHETYGKGTGYSQGMLGWNLALDQARAERPYLIVWDWPTALLNANPPIAMDTYNVHPINGPNYVKRSTIMAQHITDNMGGARYIGPRVTLPADSVEQLSYVPVATETLYSTPTDGATFAAAETRDLDLGGSLAIEEGAKALALTVTATNPAAGGYLTMWRCGDTMPSTSNLNFAAGAQRTAQAITRITDTAHLCVFSSVATDVIISIQGSFVTNEQTRLNTIAPVRPLDTRDTGKAQDLQLTVPGTGVQAAAVTVTTTGPSSGGTVTIYDCDDTAPNIANLSFVPGETVASAAFVPVSAASTLCVHVTAPDTNYPHVIVDVTGVFLDGVGLYFRPVNSTRLLDTRNVTGGWYGRQGPAQSVDVVAGPEGAKAVTGTITIVKPMFNAWLTAYACGQPLPPTSSVNARGGLILANSTTVGVEPTQRTLCIYSSHNTNTLFDVVGWWVEGTV